MKSAQTILICLELAQSLQQVRRNVNVVAKVDVFELTVPMIMDMQRMTKYTLDYDMIKSCEGELLKMLEWDLIKTTHLHFAYMLMSEGIIFESDRKQKN
jgi:hypothetical protein